MYIIVRIYELNAMTRPSTCVKAYFIREEGSEAESPSSG